ncbi:ATP-dependent RNA helicase DbpA [Spongiibacter tropicus]|uniref:ATP-dependent RNA helicase DbpA n=3 Tax=Spongiibacter TaxID=630749 RepID=UPI0023545306|nr:ATP-dependent RNA helicase DbpA [Spongiibacter tropicus]|tara:strand:- start:3897 stop:5285 length:1389 start_codon:yes stop_codon:yes gene_type:complete
MNLSETSFHTLPLAAGLLDNLASLGYRDMTAIQAAALPRILAGSDLVGQAKTGSGKTVAFGLGLLNKLEVKRFAVQGLVLCPTRELADQVARELRKLARGVHNVKILTLCGGMPFGPQVGSLAHGAHIIVGTPGRVHDHLRKRNLKLEQVHTLVLDEADRMLEMGFQETLDAIVAEVPVSRQSLLFSATYPEQIQQIARRVMRDPELLKIAEQHRRSTIDQRFYQVENNEARADAVARLLLDRRPDSAVVFCNTRRDTEELASVLRDYRLNVIALHGELDQRARDRALVCFANHSASVLVATDVAARGLDIEDLNMVINYHIARDAEVHTHRVGRTGRAGASGEAASLFTEREQHKLARLEADGVELLMGELPHPAVLDGPAYSPPVHCLQLDVGKKQKIRPGDILGALTRGERVAGSDVGKIHIFDQCAYVAVKRRAADEALRVLSAGKLKGRSVRARKIR